MYVETLDGALHLAPLENPQQILDVGTGTGIWAIDMADQYTEAEVTGIDLSPIQPEMVPVNCVFEVDDANLEWTWDDNFFDFVHVREMFGSISDWSALCNEALRCIKPGGYIEIVEHSIHTFSDDGTLPPDSTLAVWGDVMDKIGRKWGKTFNVWKESKSILERAGFVDVVDVRFKWPVNPWPNDPKLKQLGKLNEIRLIENLEAFTMRLLTQAGNMTANEAHVYLAQVRKAVKDQSIHGYLVVSVVYGKKAN
ncbi:hypothetical protein AAFC00_003726 [Neodothiora populina]